MRLANQKRRSPKVEGIEMDGKQARQTLIVRLSPQDDALIRERARTEGRSLGETLALVLRENELLRQLQQAQRTEA